MASRSLSSAPDEDQLLTEGYVAVPTTDSSTKVYKRSNEPAGGSPNQSFVVVPAGSSSSPQNTAYRMDVSGTPDFNMRDAADKVTAAQNAVGRLYDAAKQAQSAVETERERLYGLRDLAGDAWATVVDTALGVLGEQENIWANAVNAAGYFNTGMAAANDLSDWRDAFDNAEKLNQMIYDYQKKGVATDELEKLQNECILYSGVKILQAAGGVIGAMVGVTAGMAGLSVGLPVVIGTAVIFGVVNGVVNFWRRSLEKRCDGIFNKNKKKDKYLGSAATPILDPSGYVYEAVPVNRLEGVTAACYQKVTKYDMYDEPYEEIQPWDASAYGQKNPLYTNAEGFYAWDVPQGMWQVRYEKEGYASASSEWMQVPPPQFGVNIGLVSYDAPEIDRILSYPDECILIFKKYMRVSTVTGKTVRFEANGEKLSGTLKALNGEASPEDGTELATEFVFVLDDPLEEGTEVNVTVEKRAYTYAGVSADKKLSAASAVVLKPEKLEVTSELSLTYNGEDAIELKAEPAEAVAGLEVAVVNSAAEMVEVQTDKVVLDEEGKATVQIRGLFPGNCELGFELADSLLSASCKITVANLNENSGEDEKKPQNIGMCAVELEYLSAVYDGIEKRPAVTVKNDTAELSAGTDYAVSYGDNINAGTASVTITGTGDYSGSVIRDFTILKADQTVSAEFSQMNLRVGMSAQIIVNGIGKISYTSENPSVAEVSGSGKVIGMAPGTAVITVTAAGDDNYHSAVKKLTVQVTQDSVIFPSPPQAPSYNRTIHVSDVVKTASKKAQKFSIGASINAGKLTYKSNHKSVKVNGEGQVTIAKNFVGQAIITIQAAATGKYPAVSRKITVTVNPAGVKLTKVKSLSGRKMTVFWKKNAKVSGYILQYSTSKEYTVSVKTVKVKKAGMTRKTFSKLKKGKIYYVRIRTYKNVSGKTYYSVWSEKKVRVKK